MPTFRLLLVLILASLMGYTGIVIAHEGWALFPIFFGDIAKMGWPGQFNMDFTFMLLLSAVWVAWRHAFSACGLVLAALAFVGGSLFLASYLLVLTWQTKGNVNQLLLGPSRV